jgi:hypothetical protein
MMSAVRGSQRRVEPEAEPVASRGSAERETASVQIDERPTAAVAKAPAPQVERTVESRAATAPSPKDIRARAEEVRQRAMAARARRDAEQTRPVAVIDDEPELFDIDSDSFEAAPARAEVEPRVRREPSLAADPVSERRPAARPVEAESRSQGGRSGLFAINKLIHRVAGGAHASADPEKQTDRREAVEEDEGEIPAFLRRQAN